MPKAPKKKTVSKKEQKKVDNTPEIKEKVPSNAFFYVELLQDGTIQCYCWWDKNAVENPLVANEILFTAFNLANGKYNHLFGEICKNLGESISSPQMGSALHQVFDDANVFKFAMKPSDVFSSNNPKRAPFGVANNE